MDNMYERLVELAERNGMSANQLRVAAKLSPGFLSDLKSGRCNNFSRKTAEKLADVLGISVDEIYEDKITETEEIQDELFEKRKLLFDLSGKASKEELEMIIKMVKGFVDG